MTTTDHLEAWRQLRDGLVALRDSGVLGDGVFQVDKPRFHGKQAEGDRPKARPAILDCRVDEQPGGAHLGQQHLPDVLDDAIHVRIAHDDSSTAQGRPESVLTITVEVRRRGGGDSRPCASCGGAK